MNLKMPFIMLTTILISLPASSQADTRVHLNKGLNSIDLNGDGIPDTVFSATYDNNTSHPSETLNVFIRQGKNWFIVPVPDDDGFTWADLRLSASALKISGTELHRYKGRVYLIRAVKYAGSAGGGNLTDKTRVRFSRFRLEENNDDPGTSVFYWDPAGIYLTEHTFDEVNEAFQILDMEKFR
ncbi:carbapenem self-resistance protein CarG family protein [Pantoea vagans]|uniref:carbapenem self-resistance protein CarG family protein n=1 Tax=Pantoea vagans TaxID=470934 RepID=UPI003670AF39